MMKYTLLIFLSMLTFLAYTFGQKKAGIDTTKLYWLTAENMTPLGFIETMKVKSSRANNINVVTMADSFPKNWLTKEDIGKLIELVNSRDKCNCILNPLSSYIPTHDNGEVGGYAIWLIKAYKEKKKVSFGLHACPKASKAEADKLIKWRKAQIE